MHGPRARTPTRSNARTCACRHEAQRDRLRQRAEGRLVLMGLVFLMAFGSVGLRMAALATTEAEEPSVIATQAAIHTTRADITDRHGRVLATNFATNALYAHPHEIVDARAAADGLAEIFPEMDAEGALIARFTSETSGFSGCAATSAPSRSRWSTTSASRGWLFGPREMRLYPNGSIASHILGGAGFGQEAVNAAEVIGVAGIEAMFDDELRDPAREAPLALSLDLTVQATLEEVLAGGMMLHERPRCGRRSADGMRIRAKSWPMASLPDFDPNSRPRPLFGGGPGDSPLFNRAGAGRLRIGQRVQGLYHRTGAGAGPLQPQRHDRHARPLAHVRLCHTRLSQLRALAIGA